MCENSESVSEFDVEGFSERLAELIGGKRQNSAFSRRTGVGETSIRQYLAGGVPGLDKVVQIARATGVSITWLATGEGPRDSSGNSSQLEGTQQERPGGGMLQIVDPKSLDDGALVLVPRLDVEASAGTGMVIDDDDVSEMVAFDARWLRARSITPQAARVITARGDSMEPTIRSGDLLVVDTAIETAVDSGVYVVSYAGALVVKRLFMLHSGAIILSSDNKVAGRDEEIPAHSLDQLRIAGRVMWYGRIM